MENSKDNAREGRMILADLIGSEYKGTNINYDVAFNSSEGLGAATLLDVIEAPKRGAAQPPERREHFYGNNSLSIVMALT